MKPLLSILIATKNRQKYCLSAVESILMIPNEKIQVVVQDNSDDKNLEDLLEPFMADSRLIYRYTPPPFSSIDNFNAAIELSTGEYICLIGDDDGINPEIIDATVWAKENNINCIVGNLKANYRWENTGNKQFLHLKVLSNSLILGDFNGLVRKIKTQESVIKLIENGCTNYMEYDFPKLYHGIVKRDIFESIKKETGAYLKGLSPDIYAALALSFKMNDFIMIDYPLTIPGVCYVSSSIQEGEQKSNSKNIEDAPHMRDRNTPYIWDKNVPRIFCVQAIWADSGFAAIKEFNKVDLIKSFDKFTLCIRILEADISLYQRVLDFLKFSEPNLSQIEIEKKLKSYKRNEIYSRKALRILTIIKKLLGIERHITLPNITNMVDASVKLEDFLKKDDIDLVGNLNKITK